jgi:hypothetical protein
VAGVAVHARGPSNESNMRETPAYYKQKIDAVGQLPAYSAITGRILAATKR